ncbi:hypothetical protein [Microvirga yunnanensis]|uniref:hypothetical protein n=1 Tax=Microvirga yunnanensis TaxID=2953740 RepID=UPI00359FAD5B
MAKRFACCGAVHRTLDGIELLRQQEGFSLAAVDRAETRLPGTARRNLRFDHPTNEMEARFSGTYCTARVLASGTLSLHHMTRAKVESPEIQT